MNLKPVANSIGLTIAEAIVEAARAQGVALTIRTSERGYVLLSGPEHKKSELTGSGWAAKVVREGVAASGVGHGY